MNVDQLARERGWKYQPLYPKVWALPGEKCLHEQPRKDRITLKCARPKGHKKSGFNNQNHLHDVPPELQQVKDDGSDVDRIGQALSKDGLA